MSWCRGSRTRQLSAARAVPQLHASTPRLARRGSASRSAARRCPRRALPAGRLLPGSRLRRCLEHEQRLPGAATPRPATLPDGVATVARRGFPARGRPCPRRRRGCACRRGEREPLPRRVAHEQKQGRSPCQRRRADLPMSSSASPRPASWRASGKRTRGEVARRSAGREHVGLVLVVAAHQLAASGQQRLLVVVLDACVVARREPLGADAARPTPSIDVEAHLAVAAHCTGSACARQRARPREACSGPTRGRKLSSRSRTSDAEAPIERRPRRARPAASSSSALAVAASARFSVTADDLSRRLTAQSSAATALSEPAAHRDQDAGRDRAPPTTRSPRSRQRSGAAQRLDPQVELGVERVAGRGRRRAARLRRAVAQPDARDREAAVQPRRRSATRVGRERRARPDDDAVATRVRAEHEAARSAATPMPRRWPTVKP